jgi:hypothetical protein
VRTENGFGGDPRAAAAQLAHAVEIAAILSASGFGWLVQALGVRADADVLLTYLSSAFVPLVFMPSQLRVIVGIPPRAWATSLGSGSSAAAASRTPTGPSRRTGWSCCGRATG